MSAVARVVNLANSVPLGWRHDAEPQRLELGIEEFDALTGGCPRGRITEITGAPSSGRTTLLNRIFAAAGRNGEYCALVDATNSFDPLSAMAAGVDLDTLVWVRCGGNAEHALKAADLLVHSGGFGVVAMDVCDVAAGVTGRIPLSYWYRFRRAIEATATMLVILAKAPLAKACSTLYCETAREEAAFAGRRPFQLLRQARFRVDVRKPVSAGRARLAAGR
jgi:hypothetical protein